MSIADQAQRVITPSDRLLRPDVDVSGVSTRGHRGDVSPRFHAEGTVMSVMQKSPPLLTHNNAIAGFTSQSLCSPAYVCKTDSSTAIKLAPKIHQNCYFELKNRKIFWGWGIATSPDHSSGGEGDTPSSHPLPLGASFLALAMIRPPLSKPWIRPWSTWMASPPRQSAVTLSFDLQSLNQVINKSKWLFAVSCIEIVQAVHEISWPQYLSRRID